MNSYNYVYCDMHYAVDGTGCRPDVDEVWKLDWPSTAQGRTAMVPCGQDKTGAI